VAILGAVFAAFLYGMRKAAGMIPKKVPVKEELQPV
jgi:hypothetical protein